MTYEYQRAAAVPNTTLEQTLNGMGAQGWRTVYMRPDDSGGSFDVVFEREHSEAMVFPPPELPTTTAPTNTESARVLYREQVTDGHGQVWPGVGEVHGY